MLLKRVDILSNFPGIIPELVLPSWEIAWHGNGKVFPRMPSEGPLKNFT
jgi:hypothetical protein